MKKDPKLTLENNSIKKGEVLVHLRKKKTLLAIHAEFDTNVQLVQQGGQDYVFLDGHIRLSNGISVPTKIIDFLYTKKSGEKAELSFEYKVADIGEWEFMTVRFIDDDHDHDKSKLSPEEWEEVLNNHVSQSTVHYGDADED